MLIEFEEKLKFCLNSFFESVSVFLLFKLVCLLKAADGICGFVSDVDVVLSLTPFETAFPVFAQQEQTPQANYKIDTKGLANAAQVQANSANLLRYIAQYAKREGVNNYTVKIENGMYYQTDKPFAFLTVRVDALKLHYTLNTPVLNNQNILPQVKTGLATLVQQLSDREMEKT